jgi:hypothetical protein
MAVYGNSYSDWVKQNQPLVDQAAQRMAPPAPSADPYAKLDAPQGPAPVAAAPVPAPEPVPDTKAAVAPTTRNPRKALEQVRGDQVDAQNQIGDSFKREGEAKAQASTDKAALLTGSAGKAKRYSAAAERVRDQNREDQDQALNWMKEDMETLRKPPVEPKAWQKAVGILSGIVAGSVQGWLGQAGGSGIAFGLGALNDHVNRGVREQLEEKDRADNNIGRAEKYIDALGNDSANETDIAAKLYANHWLATSRELDAIAENAKVPEYRENARRMAIEAESRGRSILEQNYKQQMAEAAAAAAAKAKAAASKVLTPKDILELEKLKLQNDQLGLANDKARAGAPMDALELERIRLQNEQLGLANDGARQKLAAGADGGAPGPVDREVLDPRVWASLNDTEKAKFRTADAAYKAFDASTRKLEALLLEHGTESFGEVSKQMEALQADLLGSYKEIKELGALDNGVIEVVDRAIGDPTALFKGGDGVRAKIQASRAALKHGLEARAGNLGLGESSYGKPPPPDIRPRGEAAATAADQSTPVPMLDKTGKRYMIPSARVAAARASGMVLASEMAPQYDAPPAPPAAAPSAPTPAAPPSVDQIYSMTAAEAEENARLAQEEELVRRQLAGGP